MITEDQPMIHTNLSQVLRSTNDWLGFCEELGYSEWAVNEGGGDVQVSLTIEQAKKYGVI